MDQVKKTVTASNLVTVALVTVFLLSPFLVTAQSAHPAYYTNVSISGSTICPTSPATMVPNLGAASAYLVGTYSAFIATSSAIDTSSADYKGTASFNGTPSLLCARVSDVLTGLTADQYVVVWYNPADTAGTRIPAWYYRDFYWDGAQVQTLQSVPAFATSTVNGYCDTNYAVDNTNIITATITTPVNGGCKLLFLVFAPSTDSLTQFAQLPGQAQTHVPFSYVYGLQQIVSGFTASSTANLSAVTIQFPNIGSSTPLGNIVPTTIVGLSTSTISTYLPDSVRVSLLNLQRIALWVGLIALYYRRIIPHHAIEKSV